MHLGKSFGISPGKRNLITSGPYALLKHPAYIGYFFSELFILLLNFSIFNILIFSFSSSLYFIRAHRENKILRL